MVKTRTGVEQKTATELLKLAKKRVNFDDANIRLRYMAEVDLLNIRFSDEKIDYSRMDDNGVIRSFDENGNLVNLEILDLYGIFVTA